MATIALLPPQHNTGVPTTASHWSGLQEGQAFLLIDQ